MQSDKFLFRQADTVLDKIEYLASCYEFKTKQVLQIRLLAEEIISVISPTLKLSEGRCWVTTNEKAFSVTIDCDASINGLDKDTKEQLLKISRSEKNRGMFGMIGKIFEFLTVPNFDYSHLYGRRMFYLYDIDSPHVGYYWNPEIEGSLPIEDEALEDEHQEKDRHDLEISIIEGYADDIQVCIQMDKSDIRLEITVVKNFAAGQVDGVLF